MKFYDRENELALLAGIQKKSLLAAQMTFVVGRRRIGKTSLLIKSSENERCVYLFVARKNEALLCNEFVDEIKQQLKVEVFGDFKTFNTLFAYLMELSKTLHFTLIIDEFQEFISINPGIYSDMQHSWDSRKSESKINLILCGSIYALMKKIFENAKEPLFGRATNRIHLKAFNITTLKKILTDHYPTFTKEDLLTFYLTTGGVAKYVELLTDSGSFTYDSILHEIFSEHSLFLDEGKNVLIDEFGKDYANYFSILSLIATSKTSRVEIESVLGMNIGGFLDRLENDFGLITKIRPMFAKPGSRSIKYQIHDNFLNFWFRFIYKYRGAIEIGNLPYVTEIVKRDYTMYSGRILEKYFVEKMILEGNYSQIGSWWEKSNQNEIDIVAINENDKKIVFAEVKRQAMNINQALLVGKANTLAMQFKDYSIEYQYLSMDDM
jgi:AAA+ ATPase superfamily predicted ATPase